MGGRQRKWGNAALVSGVWLVALAVFFRGVVFSGLRKVQIAGGDSDIGYYTAEHWYRWLSGTADWKSPDFYYPVKGLLGYTDAQFLYLPPYALFRFMGADMYLALQLTAMVLVTIGYLSVYLLLRRHLNVRVLPAVAGSVAFAFSNALAIGQFHINTMGSQFVPLIVLLAAEALAASKSARRKLSITFACASGLLWGLLFFTSFYMAWFLVIVVLAAAVMILLMDYRGVLGILGLFRSEPRRWIPMVLGLAAGLAVGAVPALVIYLPVIDESGGRPFAEVLGFSARPSDVFNLGTDNWLWGRSLWPGTTPLEGVERSFAVSPILVVSAIASLVILWFLRGRLATSGRLRFLSALALTAIAITLVSWRFGDWTLWKILWKVVPGGKAIRATDRVQLVLGFLWVVVWAAAINEIWTLLAGMTRKLRSLGISVLVLLSMLVMVEQINTRPLPGLDHARRSQMFAQLPKPPVGCRSFFLIDSLGTNAAENIQTTAMLLSLENRLPTLNGLSGMAPPGWNLYTPRDPRYEAAARAWADRNGIGEGLCVLDTGTTTWSGP